MCTSRVRNPWPIFYGGSPNKTRGKVVKISPFFLVGRSVGGALFYMQHLTTQQTRRRNCWPYIGLYIYTRSIYITGGGLLYRVIKCYTRRNFLLSMPDGFCSSLQPQVFPISSKWPVTMFWAADASSSIYDMKSDVCCCWSWSVKFRVVSLVCVYIYIYTDKSHIACCVWRFRDLFIQWMFMLLVCASLSRDVFGFTTRYIRFDPRIFSFI